MLQFEIPKFEAKEFDSQTENACQIPICLFENYLASILFGFKFEANPWDFKSTLDLDLK